MDLRERLQFAINHKVENWELLSQALGRIDFLEESYYELDLEYQVYKSKVYEMKKRNDTNDKRSGD